MMKDLRRLDNKIKIVAHMDIKIIEEHRRLYSPFGLSPTLNVVGGGRTAAQDYFTSKGEWK